MIKRYCDFCGEEIVLDKNTLAGAPAELKGDCGTILIKIYVEYLAESRPDFCKYCVLDALYKLDDRGKKA